MTSRWITYSHKFFGENDYNPFYLYKICLKGKILDSKLLSHTFTRRYGNENAVSCGKRDVTSRSLFLKLENYKSA